jgi:hypothetical protein
MGWPRYVIIEGAVSGIQRPLMTQTSEKSPGLTSIVWHKLCVTHIEMDKVELRKVARSRASIRQCLFWLLGGMSLATLLVVNLIWLPGTIHDICETHEECQRVAAQGIRDQIELVLEEKEQTLRSQAMLSRPAFLAGDQVTLRQRVHRFFQRDPAIVEIGILDAQRREQLRVSPVLAITD